MNRADDSKDEQWLFQQLEAEDKQLIYYGRILIPTLELQLDMEEVSEEEHDYVHATLMTMLRALEQLQQFLASHVKAPDSQHQIQMLADFTGLAEAALEKKMQELFALGYAQLASGGSLVLTDMGKRALALGRPIKHVRRALRYCAITEQLLPKSAYQRAFKATQSLTEDDLRFIAVAVEKPEVNLQSLDEIEHYTAKQKAAANIPTEVQSIIAIEGYQGGYQSAKMALVRTVGDEHEPGFMSAWVQFEQCIIEYPLNCLPMPLKRLGKDGPRQLQSLQQTLNQDGLIVSDLEEYQYGVTVAQVASASDTWLGKRSASFYPNIVRCSILSADVQSSGLPFYRYPVSTRDQLQGRALYLDISALDASTQHAQQRLKQWYLVKDGFYQTPRSQRVPSQLHAYMAAQLGEQTLTLVHEDAERFGLNDILKVLTVSPVDEDA
ncbi:hypothetical protein [Aliidiomarina maris]|uniref:Uncharacterized protein n=1 Tax=Aliidiomarina maris TaxID=531312 RepID=A0A327WP49_9GAMM|nr:hypothetical protein [Aliidiomarina maris]RAJ92968.1 hypothetical protein B0I24_12112 [Aliidiomarina maris]RUO18458.1 hypothetical protein CWE07_13980 [Aliidiomarina maris]